MAKEVVSEVTGFKINYFAALDFRGFIKIIDILGGIEVKVEKTFDDSKYPIESEMVDNCGKSDDEIAALTATMSGEKLEDQFPCRYETLHFDKGVQHMDGTTALKYARSRHSPTDGGDFNRAARQKAILMSVKEKVVDFGFISKIIPTVKTLTRNLTTDIDLTKLNELINNAAELANYKITSIALTDKNVLIDAKSADGQYILLPRAGAENWEEVQQFINNPASLTPTVIPGEQ